MNVKIQNALRGCYLYPSLAVLALAGCGGGDGGSATVAVKQATLSQKTVPLLTVDGLQFKDMNRNGKLDAYEDWRLDAPIRVKNLVALMTLEEKAGAMFHGTLVNQGTAVDLTKMKSLVTQNMVNTFVSRMSGDATAISAEYNKLQALSEQTRLAIPISLSSDPRNHFSYTLGASVATGSFSQWPDALGLAAINDPVLTRRFGDIARQEYLAVGITQALSPQADLATEPRWARQSGTFGEDADIATAHVKAYIEGFQNGGDGVGVGSVVAVVKHWAGYGAAKDGWDSHNPYGKYMTFPGNNFAYHLKPFDGAFAAKAGSVMPTYSQPDGTVTIDGITLDSVAAGYSKALLTDLLRERKGFTGVTLSDWGITADCVDECLNGAPAGVPVFAFWSKFGTSWGVEALSRRARFVKAVLAGMDQFGGTEESHFLVEAVNAGELTSAKLDGAVTRIMLQKFQQGLFDNPYVDETKAATVVGNASFMAEGLDAQRKSMVLLQNTGKLLPLSSATKKVYLYGIDKAVAASYGLTVVDTPAQADVAIIRAEAPFEMLHANYIFGSMQHEGSLAFPEDGSNAAYEAIKTASAVVPTIVTVYLDRPAILTNVVNKAKAVIGNYGVTDVALFDVLTGKAQPKGKLPVELPSSMAAVQAQFSDLPHDSVAPLFPFGFGLSY